MDDSGIIDILLGPTGALVFAVLVIYGGWRKWWVFGWQYREKADEALEWKKAALEGTRVASKAVDLASNSDKQGKNAPF